MSKCPYKHLEGSKCPFCAVEPVASVDFSEYIEQLDIAGKALFGTQSVVDERKSVQPGIVIDEEPEPVCARPLMALVARWATGIALVGAGAAVMYAEGQRQAMPGVGFAIGLSMLVGAVLLTVGRDRC